MIQVLPGSVVCPDSCHSINPSALVHCVYTFLPSSCGILPSHSSPFPICAHHDMIKTEQWSSILINVLPVFRYRQWLAMDISTQAVHSRPTKWRMAQQSLSRFAKPGPRTRETRAAACIPKQSEKAREDGMWLKSVAPIGIPSHLDAILSYKPGVLSQLPTSCLTILVRKCPVSPPYSGFTHYAQHWVTIMPREAPWDVPTSQKLSNVCHTCVVYNLGSTSDRCCLSWSMSLSLSSLVPFFPASYICLWLCQLLLFGLHEEGEGVVGGRPLVFWEAGASLVYYPWLLVLPCLSHPGQLYFTFFN